MLVLLKETQMKLWLIDRGLTNQTFKHSLNTQLLLFKMDKIIKVIIDTLLQAVIGNINTYFMVQTKRMADLHIKRYFVNLFTIQCLVSKLKKFK